MPFAFLAALIGFIIGLLIRRSFAAAVLGALIGFLGGTAVGGFINMEFMGYRQKAPCMNTLSGLNWWFGRYCG
jgi:hypothetical protein